MSITKQQLIQISPTSVSSPLDLDALVTELNYLFIGPDGPLLTVNRQAAFIAQVAVESAWFFTLQENLNYSANALLTVFPTHFDITNVNDYARNPEKIANRVYANRMGNGDEDSGDGWKYRGRGLIQLTGKYEYEEYSLEALNNPDILTTIQGAVQSAIWYWNRYNLSNFADQDNINAITKVINGGLNDSNDRVVTYIKAKQVLSTN